MRRSSSIISTGSDSASRNASSEFSSAVEESPRWAMTSGVCIDQLYRNLENWQYRGEMLPAPDQEQRHSRGTGNKTKRGKKQKIFLKRTLKKELLPANHFFDDSVLDVPDLIDELLRGALGNRGPVDYRTDRHELFERRRFPLPVQLTGIAEIRPMSCSHRRVDHDIRLLDQHLVEIDA